MIEGLEIDELAGALADTWNRIIYPAGSTIFQEGEKGSYAYLIERGQVKISRGTGSEHKIVAMLGAGEILGEMAPIDNENRSATATAATEVEIIPISRVQLEQIVSNADPLIQLLLNSLVRRLRNVTPNNERVPQSLRLIDNEVSRRSMDVARGRAINQIRMETELRDAFARRELDLHYQPIVRLHDRGLAGFEALLRWMSPERGIVGPDQFIGVAEESGLIVPIGSWVLEHACHMLMRFQTVRERHFPDEPPLFMSANISARQLRDSHNVDSMIAVIRNTGVDPQSIKIEITEGLLLDDPEKAIVAFNRFKALGVTIALDDFGTGYSSLSYLHRFPLDTLKIDRSFVMSMLKSRESMTVIRTITRLAQDLNLSCVSEGIENIHELSTLREFGCDYGQGYLLSKPLAEKDVEQLLLRDVL